MTKRLFIAMLLLLAVPVLAWAQQQDSLTITVKGVDFKMILVQGGTFTMGGTSEQGREAYDSEKPAHKVTLSTYYIGETEVTQALWTAVMGDNPSYLKGDERPVDHVSWDDCQKFVSRLSQLTGKKFRMPTEAEWEFAARGGSKSVSYKYSGANEIDAVAWQWDNAGSKGGTMDYGSHVVKNKKPNELGIYDMSGNMWEWCSDWWGEYSDAPQTNPQGAAEGSVRVCRGGGWGDHPEVCRTSTRKNSDPDSRNSNLGLRLVLVP